MINDMAQEQIQELIVVDEAPQPLQTVTTEESRIDDPVPKPNQPVEDPILDDRAAADILSAPPTIVPPLPEGTTGALKTRAQLISKIKEVCQVRGVDAKQYNLHRRRKNSLQEIVRTQPRRKRVNPM